jgi:cytidylate kinase
MISNLATFRDFGSDPLSVALRTALHLERHGLKSSSDEAHAPFITISRQAGAGGKSLGRALIERLDAEFPHGPRWTLWDDQLVEKVAHEHALAQAYVNALEDQPHGWFHEFLHGLPFNANDQHPDDFKVYRRVASTIRALARAGRAVIVGRGGTFITADLPGGVHLRVVAPTALRVNQVAERLHVTPEIAAEVVRENDRSRAQFYRRYWPNKELTAESFTMTFNSGKMDIEQMVDCTLPLVRPVAETGSAASHQTAAEPALVGAAR